MKKILSFLLILTFVLALVSCDKGKRVEKEKAFDMTPYNEFEAAEGVVYTCNDSTLKIANGMAAYMTMRSNEWDTDFGTVIYSEWSWFVFPCSIKDDCIASSSTECFVEYSRAEYSGPGAEEYVDSRKAELDKQLQSDKNFIDRYNLEMSYLTGEVVVEQICDGGKNIEKHKWKFSINDEDGTFRLLRKEEKIYYPDKVSLFTLTIREFEHDSAGKTIKVAEYTIYGDKGGTFSGGVNFVVYDDDGTTWESYNLVVKDDLSYEVSELWKVIEIRADGTEKHTYFNQIQVYGEDIFPYDRDNKEVFSKRIYLYDENNNLISAEEYDDQGNYVVTVSIKYDEIEHTKSSQTVKFFEEGNLALRVEIEFYENDDWGSDKNVSFGSRYVTARNTKTRTDYDADGNVIGTIEYDEEGRKRNK